MKALPKLPVPPVMRMLEAELKGIVSIKRRGSKGLEGSSKDAQGHDLVESMALDQT